jgi:2-amino-4-hydroxy-6-hydroxymethyldihydropteridine diphosphokinase
MNITYLSLGSNEGNRMQWMQRAMDMLSENSGKIIKKSSVYETAAWGLGGQPDFLNMALEMETNQTPANLLTEIHGIEKLLGRQREIKWGQRTLDIDILLYNDEIIELPGLTIPHLYLQERRFTLMPLAEIAPDYIHPVLHKSIIQLLADCKDELEVRIFSKE